MRIGCMGNSEIRHKDWLAERDRDDMEKYSVFFANPPFADQLFLWMFSKILNSLSLKRLTEMLKSFLLPPFANLIF